MCDVSARRVHSLGLPLLGYRYYSYWQMRRREVRPGYHLDSTGVQVYPMMVALNLSPALNSLTFGLQKALTLHDLCPFRHFCMCRIGFT
jgi:hypothetical protein